MLPKNANRTADLAGAPYVRTPLVPEGVSIRRVVVHLGDQFTPLVSLRSTIGVELTPPVVRITDFSPDSITEIPQLMSVAASCW